MSENQKKNLDEWQEALENKLQELHICQKKQNLKSCTVCTKFFDCQLRDEYVKAVYQSMNKGAGGGFEF